MKEQVEVKELKEGRYVIIDDEACIIKSIAKSKPGKHGAAKARIDAIGIFDNQKRSTVSSVSTKVYVPIVERKSAQVLSISGNMAQIMDLADFTTFEIPIPEEYMGKVKEGEEIQYLSALEKMKIDMRV
ncbi:Elongation factor P [Methanosarcinaceae archaeon Ag5]|uniref:Translation initiation factor 5A n=1 Tax=Methanolapillus africanus TaxID=3028297 RepID=A0AAE4MI03_9EURY|nr:Elongation factor P [Methanosarcinaceae archaeon Ag5]